MTFGPPNREDDLEGYIGKWVFISSVHGNSFYQGKLNKISGIYAVLNPHQTSRWDSEKGLIRIILDEDETIPFSGCAFDPTTEESVRNYCAYQNKQNKEKDKKDSTDTPTKKD